MFPPRVRGRFLDAERGLSPVFGATLVVAITVLLAAVVIVMLTGAADPDVAPTTDTAVSLDATNAGTDLTTEFSGGQEIDVQLRGETIATIDEEDTGNTIFLPTAPGDDDEVRFAVNFTAGASAETTTAPITAGETHVVVGTYDGESYRFYLDGILIDSGTYESEMNMGEMHVGKDDPDDVQYFDGRMYECRLYYAAFDDHQVEMLTRVMD